MLALSQVVKSPKGDQDHQINHGLFSEVDDNLLDYFDFSYNPFPSILPDLEVDPAELLAEFSSNGEDLLTLSTCDVHASDFGEEKGFEAVKGDVKVENISVKCADEVLSAVTTEDSVLVASDTRSSVSAEGQSKRKSLSSSAAKAVKHSHGKRIVKVDWTPELHRRFVQAVEQLGINKAVPSRILELMGIDCLTRHNIASHLQKYRSHRKHLLAREAEAASWSQKRQIYAPAGVHGATRDMNPWTTPAIGFPPHPLPPATMMQPFRPLHVWGHPTGVEPSLVPMWPCQPPPSPWAPQPPLPVPPDPSYWHHHYNAARKGWVPHSVTPGTPCIPQPVPPMRFPTSLVPGILPHQTYRPITQPPSKHASLPFHIESHPSKESIDAAIGDVLVKPWLPLPLGLKPPSMESVMVELQKQGISKVPPTCG